MEEALAGVESALGELRKPLDTVKLRSRTAGGSEKGREFSIAHYMRPDQVRVRLRSTGKFEVIEELLDLLVETGVVNDREKALRAILDRESSMSTGMAKGVAIPHGKTDSVRSLVCAVGISKEGIDFESMDGGPSRIIILTLSPENRPAPHLEFMATISRTMNSEGRSRLLSCTTDRELYEALS
jgi:PTS system nitrogen regulatory IIA component